MPNIELLKKLITEQVMATHDADLLDLVLKLLIAEA